MSPAMFDARWIRSSAALTALVALGALTACGGSTEPKTPPKDRVPASIVSNVTGPLTGLAGAQLNTALSVTVLNKEGQPADSVPVAFAVATGGGTVSNQSVLTDATGKATTTWTLGISAGVQTVTATAGTLTPITFSATATAGAPSTLTKNSTDPQTAAAGGTVAVPPSVKVTDKNGNPVSGVLVTFIVASGGGSVTGGAVNTDTNGVATAGSWKLGPVAGTNTLTATANGITATVTFTATGTAGAVTQVRITSTPPATMSIGQTFTLTAQALDANNNVVAYSPITFTSTNTAVVTVTSAGVVTGVGAGSADVTATSNNVTAGVTFNVVGSPPPTGTRTDTVAMSSGIGGLAVVNNTAYVARSTAGAIAVVDLPSAKIVDSINLGARTVDVAASNDGSVMAAANAGPDQIVFITASTKTVHDTLALNATPVKLAMTSTGSKLYADLNSFELEVIDPASHTITSEVPIAGTVTAMRMAPGDSLLYLVTKFGIYEFSTIRNSVKRLISDVPTSITDIAISKDGKTMFITDGSNNLTVYQLAPGGLANNTISGFNPSDALTAVGLTPDGRQLWVAASQHTYIMDITNGVPVVPPPTGPTTGNPSRIVFTQLGTISIIVDSGSNSLIITH